MKMNTFILAAVVALVPFGAMAEEAHVAPVKAYVEENIMPWLSDPIVIDAIKAQNAKHAGLSQGDIDALDAQWREGVDGGDTTLIDETLANDLSGFLKEKQAESDGLITEIFVMDDKGLNVGQSDVTSDYWQGDEGKFKNSFEAGANAVFVDEAEKDESTQKLQSQASMTISDADGNPIGAITIGINLDEL